ELSESGNRRGNVLRLRDLDMRCHGADGERVALSRDRGESADGAEIDDAWVPIEAQFQRRKQRLAAGKNFGARYAFQRGLGLSERGRAAIVESVHGLLPIPLPACVTLVPRATRLAGSRAG